MRLSDKVVLITGGTSGIGAASARLFGAEGARVVFTGRRRAHGEALQAEVRAAGGQAVYVEADHATLAGCEQAVRGALAAWGRLDVLFNNAGLVLSGTAENTTEAEWAELMNLNVTGVWRMCKLVLPVMRAQGGGVIINNASDWGMVGAPNALAYATSKGAVVQLTRSLALDHAREGIRVNAVCPGDTFVERWQAEGYFRNAAGDVDQMLREMGQDLPLGRVARAEEIARAALFLASEDSSFMTGGTLVVDGGNTAR